MKAGADTPLRTLHRVFFLEECMLKNYLKIAIRHLWRNPVHTGINILGLAVGVACCLLVAVYVVDELGYDRFHEKSDRIYRVVLHRHGESETTHQAVTPPAFAPVFKAEFPEIVESVRFFDVGRTLVRHDEAKFFEPKVYFADSTVFDVFTLPLKVGDPKTALTAPNTVVVSEFIARRYFGDVNPVGRTLTLNEGEMTVTGVMEDVPRQSHLDLNILASFQSMYDFQTEERLSNWHWQQFFTYVLLKEGADPRVLTNKIDQLLRRQADPNTSAQGFTYDAALQPLLDVYLKSSHLRFNWGRSGNITYVYALASIAIFILLIACLNFMNLSTARSTRRAREVGMRKVIGARRRQLIAQFLGEATLTAMLALGLAIIFTEAALPAFGDVVDKELDLVYRSGPIIPMLIAFGLLVGLAAGSYPAFFLSSFRPARVLKGTGDPSGAGFTTVRRVLVVTQFAISITLMIGTAIVYRQLEYVRSVNLGYERELIAKLPLRGSMDENVHAVKAELLRHSSIAGAAASWGSPGSFAPGDGIRLPGREAQWPARVFTVDHDFVEVYGMELVAGRDFRRDFVSDENSAFLLNESAANGLGWSTEEAIGQEIWWDAWGQDAIKKGRVVGIVRDFHYSSLHETVEPAMLTLHPVYGQLSVKVRAGAIEEAVAAMKLEWEKWAPEWPFEYEFLDEELAQQYADEKKLATLTAVFAGLAILVACLGLFGLASYVVERRTKEIGIRKTLGASVQGLVVLLSREFALLVAVAFMLAVPMAYLTTSRWLRDFAYRVDVEPWVFAWAGAVGLLIALATVSFHTVRTAFTNPVRSLRCE